MNEQIKALAKQSGLKIESWMTNPPKPFQILGSVEDFEKFAELIVKECIKVAANQRNPTTLNYKPSERFVEDLKQHFGVK